MKEAWKRLTVAVHKLEFEKFLEEKNERSMMYRLQVKTRKTNKRGMNKAKEEKFTEKFKS